MSLSTPELDAFAVFFTGQNDQSNIYEVGPDVTTFVSDDNVSTYLNVGNYTISVYSVNSVGHSETVSAPLGIQSRLTSKLLSLFILFCSYSVAQVSISPTTSR